jgi:hypothetical protein
LDMKSMAQTSFGAMISGRPADSATPAWAEVEAACSGSIALPYCRAGKCTCGSQTNPPAGARREAACSGSAPARPPGFSTVCAMPFASYQD